MMNNLFHWSDRTWLVLDQWGILIGLILSAVTVSAFIIGAVKWKSLKGLLSRNSFPDIGQNIDSGQSWDAIIFLVSDQYVPKWIIDQGICRQVGLVASSKSLRVAEEIRKHAEKRGITCLPVSQIENPDSPVDTRRAVAHLLSSLKEKGLVHCAVDLTGGKKTMTLGAFMAAEEFDVESVYVATDYDESLKKPDMATAKMLSVSR